MPSCNSIDSFALLILQDQHLHLKCPFCCFVIKCCRNGIRTDTAAVGELQREEKSGTKVRRNKNILSRLILKGAETKVQTDRIRDINLYHYVCNAFFFP